MAAGYSSNLRQYLPLLSRVWIADTHRGTSKSADEERERRCARVLARAHARTHAVYLYASMCDMCACVSVYPSAPGCTEIVRVHSICITHQEIRRDFATSASLAYVALHRTYPRHRRLIVRRVNVRVRDAEYARNGCWVDRHHCCRPIKKVKTVILQRIWSYVVCITWASWRTDKFNDTKLGRGAVTSS